VTMASVYQPEVRTPYVLLTGACWEDVKVSMMSTNVGQSAPPTMTKFKDNGAGSQGVFGWAFSATTEQELYFSVQLPHAYKVGTDVYPHAHFTTLGTGTGGVVWGLEYVAAPINGTYAATSTVIQATYTIATNSASKHMLLSLPVIPGTSLGISSVIMCRVFRVAANAADTFASTAFLTDFDFHIQVDSMGSRQETAK
jgi:hypothetical protein